MYGCFPTSTHHCLSVYGFRKVCNTYSSGVGRNISQESDGWHFRHSHFRKGAEHLLQYVKRKRGVGSGGSGQFNMNLTSPDTVLSASSSKVNPAISATSALDNEGIIADTSQNQAAVASNNALQTRLQLIEDNLQNMESKNAYVCSHLLEMQRIQTYQNQVTCTFSLHYLHCLTGIELGSAQHIGVCPFF